MKLASLMLLIAVTSAMRINKDDTEAMVSGPDKVKEGDEEAPPPGNPRISAAAKAENLAEGLEVIANATATENNYTMMHEAAMENATDTC